MALGEESDHAIQNIAELHKSGDLTLEQITEKRFRAPLHSRHAGP